MAAPFWDDLTGAGGTASYLTTGTAPNRTFTFEWLNWRELSAGAAQFSFQVQLVEGSNVMRFVYRLEPSPVTFATASIGLSGVGTGSGSFLSLDNASAAPSVSSTTENRFHRHFAGFRPGVHLHAGRTQRLPYPAQPYGFGHYQHFGYGGLHRYEHHAGTLHRAIWPRRFQPGIAAFGHQRLCLPYHCHPFGGPCQPDAQHYLPVLRGHRTAAAPAAPAASRMPAPSPRTRNPAVNDECTQALPLTIAAACTTPLSGTVYGATQSLAPTTGCGGTIANDVWYSFVATATALQLTTGAQFSGYYDLRSGACTATTSISCGLLGTTTAPSQVVLSGMTTGQTYFLRVYTTGTPVATTSAFTLCLTPVINYCNTGLGGSCGFNDITAVSIAGTTLNATGLTCPGTAAQAYTTYPATGANTATLQSGVPYQLSVTMGTSSIASLWIDYNHNLVFEASEFTQITTSSTGTTPVVVTFNIPTNAVQGLTGLRIRTRSAGSPNGATDACTQFFSGETKDFTITVGPPAACPTASNVSVGTITATTAVLSFTPSASATNYTLTLTPQGGTATTQTITAAPVNLTPLTPNTTYTLSLVGNCTGGSTSPAVVLTFSTLPLPATNDECTTAVPVPVTTTCTTPTNGTVLGATQSLAPTTGCGGTTALDVWYSFVATSNSHVITVTPQFAAVYDVRSGACASTTSIYCTTVAAATAGVHTIGGLTTGLTYFIRVYAAGTQPTGAATAFTLCVTPGPTTPVNDDCAGAINVPVQFGTCITQTSADNSAATSSTGAPAPTCASYQGQDIWFKTTVPVTGTVTISTLLPTGGSNIADTGLSVYSGTCATLAQIDCNDDSNGTLYSQL